MGAHSWEKSYPAGMRWDIEIESRPAYEILNEAVAAFGPVVALDFISRS